MAAGHRARWQEMSPLLDELLALESDARTARLSELRRSDAGLAEALNGLLAQASMVEKLGFLDDAAVDCPAETLAGHAIGAYMLERAIGYGGDHAVPEFQGRRKAVLEHHRNRAVAADDRLELPIPDVDSLPFHGVP